MGEFPQLRVKLEFNAFTARAEVRSLVRETKIPQAMQLS